MCVESAAVCCQWHGAHRLVQECIQCTHSEFVLSLQKLSWLF